VLLLPFAFACIPNETMVVAESMVPQCSGEVPKTMRVASYNVKSGAQSSLAEVGDVLVQIHPDVVALQEINVDPEHEDQAKILAGRLGFPYVYAAALSRGLSHTYGIALISRFPLKKVDRIDLRAVGAAEPRVAIDAQMCVGNTELRVLATHADVWAPAPNIDTLCQHLAPTVTQKTLLLGDLNVMPTERSPKEIEAHGLTDVIGKLSEGPTFWSADKRIDYVFVDSSLMPKVIDAAIGTSKASDHYPVWVDIAMN
jgi:endonuclease/exonuclease/phosphatase family metal-dependent hydrolase